MQLVIDNESLLIILRKLSSAANVMDQLQIFYRADRDILLRICEQATEDSELYRFLRFFIGYLEFSFGDKSEAQAYFKGMQGEDMGNIEYVSAAASPPRTIEFTITYDLVLQILIADLSNSKDARTNALSHYVCCFFYYMNLHEESNRVFFLKIVTYWSADTEFQGRILENRYVEEKLRLLEENNRGHIYDEFLNKLSKVCSNTTRVPNTGKGEAGDGAGAGATAAAASSQSSGESSFGDTLKSATAQLTLFERYAFRYLFNYVKEGGSYSLKNNLGALIKNAGHLGLLDSIFHKLTRPLNYRTDIERQLSIIRPIVDAMQPKPEDFCDGLSKFGTSYQQYDMFCEVLTSDNLRPKFYVYNLSKTFAIKSVPLPPLQRFSVDGERFSVDGVTLAGYKQPLTEYKSKLAEVTLSILKDNPKHAEGFYNETMEKDPTKRSPWAELMWSQRGDTPCSPTRGALKVVSDNYRAMQEGAGVEKEQSSLAKSFFSGVFGSSGGASVDVANSDYEDVELN